MGKKKHITGWLGLAYLNDTYVGGHAGSHEDVMLWASSYFGTHTEVGEYKIVIQVGIMPEYREEYL